MTRIGLGLRQLGSGVGTSTNPGCGKLDAAIPCSAIGLWATVENRRNGCAATVSHALALAGLVAGYLVTFVLLGGATG